MAETPGEKTEEATPQRREEARREANVPRSQELNTAVLLVGSAVVVNLLGAVLGEGVFDVLGSSLAASGTGQMDARFAVVLLRDVGWKVLGVLSLFLLSMGGVALAVAGVQGRGVLSIKPLEPKWEKLDPVRNAKRMFGTQPWMELFKSLLKLAIVALAVRWSLGAAWAEIVALVQQSPAALLDVVRRYAVRLLLTAGGAYLVLGLLDYAYQIWRHEKSLRMSKEDIKQELKQSEIDPLVRQRMRSAARARLRRQMFEQVPSADVVVTNPTHIAVALKYEQNKDIAPIIVAMGRNKIAERIKAIAAEHAVPQVENKPVARALLASGKVGAPIPQELYLAIIEIYAFIIRQRQAGRQGGKG